MKYISRKQLLLKIKNEKYYTADEKLFESIKEKLEPQSEPVYSRKRSFRSFYRVGAGLAACFVIGFIVILSVTLASSQKSNASIEMSAHKNANKSAQATAAANPSSGGEIFNGPSAGLAVSGGNAASGSTSAGIAMYSYYQYKDGYYKVEYPDSQSDDKVNTDYKDIQNKIIKDLGNGIYEISGYDPSDCIAISNDFYYFKADFAFKDNVTLDGTNYVIAPSQTPEGTLNSTTDKMVYKLGKSLGKAGSFQAYEMLGYDKSEKIIIELDKSKNSYCIAYNLPTSFNYKGNVYYTNPFCVVNYTEGYKSIGKVENDEGSYEAYTYSDSSGEDISQQILVKVGSNIVTANSFTPTNEKPPASWYGSPQESMYPTYSDILFNNIDYRVDSTFNYSDEDKLKAKIGAKLGDVTINSYTYGIYEINGIDPKKELAVKNNQMYLEYAFFFNAEVKYNGSNYVITQDAFGGNVGKPIGKTDNGYQVDSVVGVDPNKEIIVVIGGNTENAVRE